MTTVLLIIHLFVTLALIGVVLIQRSEGGGLGIGSTQGMGGFMSGRGTANLLTRTTAILGTMFFLLSLALALLNRGTMGVGRSLLDVPVPASTVPVSPAGPLIPGAVPGALPATTTPATTTPATTMPATTTPATTMPATTTPNSPAPATSAPVAPAPETAVPATPAAPAAGTTDQAPGVPAPSSSRSAPSAPASPAVELVPPPAAVPNAAPGDPSKPN